MRYRFYIHIMVHFLKVTPISIHMYFANGRKQLERIKYRYISSRLLLTGTRPFSELVSYCIWTDTGYYFILRNYSLTNINLTVTTMSDCVTFLFQLSLETFHHCFQFIDQLSLWVDPFICVCVSHWGMHGLTPRLHQQKHDTVTHVRHLYISRYKHIHTHASWI